MKRLMPIAETLRRTGTGRTTLLKLVRERKFPQPVKVGGVNMWLESEVEDWIDHLIEIRNARPDET